MSLCLGYILLLLTLIYHKSVWSKCYKFGLDLGFWRIAYCSNCSHILILVAKPGCSFLHPTFLQCLKSGWGLLVHPLGIPWILQFCCWHKEKNFVNHRLLNLLTYTSHQKLWPRLNKKTKRRLLQLLGPVLVDLLPCQFPPFSILPTILLSIQIWVSILKEEICNWSLPRSCSLHQKQSSSLPPSQDFNDKRKEIHYVDPAFGK